MNLNLSRKKQNAATAQSSNTSKVTVSVSSDQAMLTVSARARGSVVITVTADDGNGGTVSDTFTVTVKAAPMTPVSGVTDLAAGEMRDISPSGVFKDPAGDDWWVSQVEMSDPGIVWAWPSADSLTLTVEGSEAGSSTATVHAQDSDGNAVRDTFAVTVTD